MSTHPSGIFVFVYGSLRNGGANPHAAFLHARCRTAGAARMPGRLFRNGTCYGALYEPGSDSGVFGEVLELPGDRAGEILASLDRYEGIGAGVSNPAAFRRDRVTVRTADGAGIECWTWIHSSPPKGWSCVRHGDALTNDGNPREGS